VEAGTYVVTVKDLSAFHNFHLTGPGVNKWTSVPKQGTTTWKLTLRDGTYRYVCDPHATSMKGKLEVVS
jgi:plastocyanin